jgi:hypothetical protein
VSVGFHELGAESIQQGPKENYIMGNIVICVTRYYSDGQIKENEIGWACGTYGKK